MYLAPLLALLRPGERSHHVVRELDLVRVRVRVRVRGRGRGRGRVRVRSGLG